MKPAKMMTQLVAGVFCCLTVTALYAVCVTPTQLTGGATATAGLGPFIDDFDFVNSILKGKGSFSGLSTAAATSLGATDTPTAISTRLKGNSQDWQTIPEAPYGDSNAPKDPEKKALQATLIKVQKWASYGELVIAVDQNHIAILVPGDTTTDAGAVATTKWGQLNAPNIAYAGVSGGGGFPGKAKELMSVPFSDPSKVAFFRYKN